MSILELEATIDAIHFWFMVSTGVVAVGLVLEYQKDIRKLWASVKDWVRNGVPLNWDLLKKTIGGLLVTIGVTGEFGLDLWSTGYENDLRKANALVIGQLHERAAKAEAATKGHDAEIIKTKARVADAERQAAEANRIAETERLERMRLEAIIQPRFLSGPNQKHLREACNKFANRGIRVEVVPSSIDMDGQRLASQIVDSLNGPLMARFAGPVLSMAGEQEGIVVSGDRTTQELVRVLVETLAGPARVNNFETLLRRV